MKTLLTNTFTSVRRRARGLAKKQGVALLAVLTVFQMTGVFAAPLAFATSLGVTNSMTGVTIAPVTVNSAEVNVPIVFDVKFTGNNEIENEIEIVEGTGTTTATTTTQEELTITLTSTSPTGQFRLGNTGNDWKGTGHAFTGIDTKTYKKFSYQDTATGTPTITARVTSATISEYKATAAFTITDPVNSGGGAPDTDGPVRNVEDDSTFSTIQEAIDAATTGADETIEVSAGTYNEAIDITKSLTIKGVGDVAINGQVKITAAGGDVTLSNLRLTTSGNVVAVKVPSAVALNSLTLDGLTINSYKSVYAGDSEGAKTIANLTIKDSKITSNYPVYIDHAVTNLSITGNEFTTVGGYTNGGNRGVVLAHQLASSNVTFNGNTFVAGTESDLASMNFVKYEATNQTLLQSVMSNNFFKQNNGTETVNINTALSADHKAIVVAPTPDITNASAYYMDKGSYTAIGVDFKTVNVTTAKTIELRVNRVGGGTYSIFAKPSLVTAINSAADPTSTSGPIVIDGERTSGSWTYQTGTWSGPALPESVDVIITLANGDVITENDATIGSLNGATWDDVKPEAVSPVVTSVTPTQGSFIKGSTQRIDISVANVDAMRTGNLQLNKVVTEGQRPSNADRKVYSLQKDSAGWYAVVDTGALTDGRYLFKVEAHGYEGVTHGYYGNNSAWQYPSYYFIVDNTAPQITRWALDGKDHASPYTLTDGQTFKSKDINVQFRDNHKLAKVVINSHEIVDGWADPKSFDAQWFVNRYAEEGDNTVVLHDEAGNMMTYNFVVDAVAPSVDALKLNGNDVEVTNLAPKNCSFAETPIVVSTKVKVDALVADTNLSYQNFIVRSVNSGGCTYVNHSGAGIGGVADVSNLADGLYRVDVRTGDKAGNTTTKHIDILVDNTNPGVTAQLDSTNNPTTVSGTITDTGSGADYAQYSVRVLTEGGWKEIIGFTNSADLEVNEDGEFSGPVILKRTSKPEVSLGIDNYFDSDLNLIAGEYVLRVRGFDKVGNEKSGIDLPFTLGDDPAGNEEGTDTSTDSETTADATASGSSINAFGTAPAGATVKVSLWRDGEDETTDDTKVGNDHNVTADEDGNWATTFTDLAPGTYYVIATIVEDDAEGESAHSEDVVVEAAAIPQSTGGGGGYTVGSLSDPVDRGQGGAFPTTDGDGEVAGASDSRDEDGNSLPTASGDFALLASQYPQTDPAFWGGLAQADVVGSADMQINTENPLYDSNGNEGENPLFEGSALEESGGTGQAGDNTSDKAAEDGTAKKSSWWPWALLIAVIAVGGWFYRRRQLGTGY